jgi:hypothetical protein
MRVTVNQVSPPPIFGEEGDGPEANAETKPMIMIVMMHGPMIEEVSVRERQQRTRQTRQRRFF